MPCFRCAGLRRRLRFAAGVVLLAGLGGSTAGAQGVDCGRLQQEIARGGGGGRSAAALRRQNSELARTRAYAHQLGCDQFTLFGGNPQCGGINQRVQQLQAGLEQLQGGGGGGDLVARFNANCRGGQAPAAQPRGFFESLFGGPSQEERREPLPQMPAQSRDADSEDGNGAHGGSQAVCVRTCDGGFFPLGISARRGKESLTEMCQALCPGTETAVYTRSPSGDIRTAASLDGRPYTDLPNALKFEKTFTPACACRQAGKNWAETLANAEEVLDSTRKGDIVVTKEKSDELSRPKLDPRATAAMLAKSPGKAAPGKITADKASPADASKLAADAADNETGSPPETAATDGTAHRIRRVGPQP